jgi:hypothetical protein
LARLTDPADRQIHGGLGDRVGKPNFEPVMGDGGGSGAASAALVGGLWWNSDSGVGGED